MKIFLSIKIRLSAGADRRIEVLRFRMKDISTCEHSEAILFSIDADGNTAQHSHWANRATISRASNGNSI